MLLYEIYLHESIFLARGIEQPVVGDDIAIHGDVSTIGQGNSEECSP